MAFVPVLCPSCGASIQVDPSSQTYTCTHCGTSFVTEKVINNTNYSTVHNVTNNITKVINGQESDDASDFCNRGLAHLKLENFEDARKCFADAIKKEPSVGSYYVYYLVAISKNFTSVKHYFENLVIYSDGDDYYFKLDYIFKLLSDEEKAEFTKEYGFNFSANISDFVFDVAQKIYTSVFDEALLGEQNYLLDDPDNLNNKIFEILNKKQRKDLSETVKVLLQFMMENKLDFSKMFAILSNIYFEYFDEKACKKSIFENAKMGNGKIVINELTRKILQKDGVLRVDDENVKEIDFRLDSNADDFDKFEVTENLVDFLVSGTQLPTFKVIEFEDGITLSKIEHFFNFYLLSTNTQLVIFPNTLDVKHIALNLNFRFGKETDSNKIYTKFRIAKNINIKIKATVKDRTGIFTYLSKHTSTEKGVYTYSLAIKKGKTKKQKRDLSMLGWFIAGGIAIGAIVFFAIKLFA